MITGSYEQGFFGIFLKVKTQKKEVFLGPRKPVRVWGLRGLFFIWSGKGPFRKKDRWVGWDWDGQKVGQRGVRKWPFQVP